MSLSRRQFIASTGISTVAIASSLPLFSIGLNTNRLDKIGFISGIVSNFMETDWKVTLEQLASFGYTEMECGKYYGNSASEFRKFCDNIGINVIAGGSSLVEMQKDTQRKIDEAIEMGKKYWVCYWPWIGDAKNITADDSKKAAESLNALGNECKKAGIKLCWHNHNMEFEKDTGEGLPFDIIMQNTDPDTVFTELDIYWVYKGGGNPIECLNKYPGRFEILHVKDMDASDAKSFACPGSGIIDFAPVFKLAWEQGIRHYIVERDNEKNGIECLKNSAKYLKNLSF